MPIDLASAPLWRGLILFGAGAIASGLNAVGGGGSLVTFPTLIALGVPPLVANSTNSAALWPGSLGSALGLLGPLRAAQSALPRLLIPTIVGAALGAALLARFQALGWLRRDAASRVVRFGRKEGRITAICKGSGMIAPQLASTIAVICTDVAIGPALLQRALVGAMDGSFNNLTVDNDMSTNDMVLGLANGALGNPEITEPGPDFDLFVAQLQSICAELAKEVARDGEGATKLLEVRVSGAPNRAIATDLARSVAGSTLVKAAIFGADPNWGRILATVGARCGSQKYAVDPSASKVTVQGVCVYDTRPMFDPREPPGPLIANDANEGPSVPGHKSLRALAAGVKHHTRHTVAGGLGQAHIARDDRVKHLVAKVRLELITDLLLQGNARIKHHTQQANQLQIAVQVGVHLFDRIDQIGQPFQRKIFTLHWHQHRIRRRHRVDRQQVQRGWTINKNVIVFFTDRRQRGPQPEFAGEDFH